MLFSPSALVVALATSATAHMILNHPIPFGQATLNSSPLAPADFPCKQRSGVYDITQMNQWNAGETQVIDFTGSAVHGGGSCQFSITTDAEPTLNSQWKVIHSVIGGCPSNVTGNLEENAAGHGAATFPVTMPSNIPDGRYTFGWTWLNKVGNREFYMNCAPVQVGKGSGSASTASVSAALSSLPDMFVANLPATECTTSASQDFNYPNPGQSVVEGNGASLGDTLTGAGCAKQNKLGAGNGQLGTPSQPDTPSQSKAASTVAPKASAVPSNPGGVFAPGASSVPAAVPTAKPTTPAAAKPVPTAAPAPAPAPAQPSSAPKAPDSSNGTNPPAAGNGQCTPCSNDGAVVCIGSKQFGLCNRGCAVAQDLALGMVCSNGAVVGAKKRSYFPRAHLHRRHGASRFI